MIKSNKILILGPDTNDIGGISECIKALLNSKLDKEFDFYHFKTDVIFNGRLILKVYKKLFSLLSFIKVLLGGYQICHIHSSSYFGFFERMVYAVFCKLFCTKVVFHIHGGEYLKFYNASSMQWLIKAFLSKIDYVVYVDKKFEATFSNDKSKFIPNMIAMPDIVGSIKNNVEHVFLSVSVLEARKNVDFIIDCCHELAKKNLKFKFYICGYGPEKEYLERLVVDLGLSDSILFLGGVSGDQKSNIFNKANTFILASSSESFGIVLIESLSFGVDIISTPVGIAPELSSNLNGVDIFEINDKEQLLKIMERKIIEHNGASIPNLKNVAYCDNNYSIESVQNLYSEVYKDVISEY